MDAVTKSWDFQAYLTYVADGEVREVLNAIFYVLLTGCQWRLGGKPSFLKGGELEVAVRNSRWVLTYSSAGKAAAELLRCYFGDD